MSTSSLVASAVSKAGSNSLWPSKSAWSQTLSQMTSSRRRRYPKLRLSPSRILALRLRSKTDSQKRAYRHVFEFAAKQRADRLPLLMFQVWLARQDIQNEPRVFQSISSISHAEWKDRFHSLEARGWSREELDHWIWILSGEDGDVRIQRLVSTDVPKPMFLMMLLARSDEKFRKTESIFSLMEYASRYYIRLTPQPLDSNGVTPSRKMAMTLTQSLLFLRRIVHHVLRLCPRAIITVARFTVNCIRGIPDADSNGYHQRCEIFNNALQLFKRPATTQPIANMEFNWRAQKLLLALSDDLSKPLIINKASYRAVREALIGLKKSKTERAVAARYAKSWPPYRQDFDGLDAKRTLEDDYSRSVKAGMHMKEAGYPEDHFDHALGALGGMDGNSPTIQTRSLPPREWKGDEQGQNLYSRWAMMIRATRNQQEAWKKFNSIAAESGESPNVQVYGEMFVKLRARLIHPTSTALPGDSQEIFPIHDANYSEYELARLSPPTVNELYDQMIRQGVKPEGFCLQTLLIGASSLDEAFRYLRDSGMNDVTVRSLALFKEPSYEVLSRIPLSVFANYIQLLCRLQPNRRGRQKLFPEELLRIRHAIKLARIRLRSGTTEGLTVRPPWVYILRALAREHICVLNGTAADNDAEALSIVLDITRHVQKTVGMDPEMFLYLCRTVQKAAASRLNSRDSPIGENDTSALVPSAHVVSNTLKSVFSQITKPIGVPERGLAKEAPQFMHSIGPAHLHTYMRTLAFLEDTTAMKELLQWMLKNETYVNEEVDRIGNRGHMLLGRILCAFQAFAGLSLEQQGHKDMMSQMGLVEETVPWTWPTPEEVDNYIQSDQRGTSSKLQQSILAKSWLTSSQQESTETEVIGMAST